MSINEHATSFAGLPVVDYDPERGIIDPGGSAHRLSIGWDAHERGETFAPLLARFLDDPGALQVEALVLGAWEPEDSTISSAEVVATLTAASERLAGLRAIFLGDIIGEECEISWITHSDVTPLLRAYTMLEHFQIRGASGLVLEPFEHEHLKTLVIESGGLPAAVVRGVVASKLRRLEHLELYLGTSDYGGDATPADLAPILDGQVFPALRYLGLRDSESADEIAAALADAAILDRIEVLDLSLGNLGDEGLLALLQGGRLGRLKKLDIHYHFASDEVLDGVKALGIEFDASDRQEPYRSQYDGTEHRFIAVSE